LQLYHADDLMRTSLRDLAPFRELIETHRKLLLRSQGKAESERK
jgi:hypothetical protein